MVSSLPLVNAVLRALRLLATTSHVEVAARAARLVGNLSPDPRFISLLQDTHSLEPLLRVRPSYNQSLVCACQTRPPALVVPKGPKRHAGPGTKP